MSKDDGKIEITSINQSGGITAHTVNVVAPAGRRVTDSVRAQMRAIIPAGSRVEVEFVHGDPEALKFAQELIDFLNSDGRPVSSTSQSMFPRRMVGQNVTRRVDGSYHILIGAGD